MLSYMQVNFIGQHACVGMYMIISIRGVLRGFPGVSGNPFRISPTGTKKLLLINKLQFMIQYTNHHYKIAIQTYNF